MKRSLICLAFCCFFSAAAMAQKDTTLLSPVQLEKLMDAGNIQLLDVRTPEEYKKGHLAKSRPADWKNRAAFEAGAKTLDTTKAVYVYCAGGVRSHAAAEWLRSNGFKLVYELDGGINEWMEQKKPVEK